MTGFPVDDWQFWVVTAVVGGSLAVVISRWVRATLRRRRGVPRAVRTTLTVGGTPVDR